MKYHCECQSNDDASILVRFFEYDEQIALDDGEVRGNVLTLPNIDRLKEKFPKVHRFASIIVNTVIVIAIVLCSL